MAVQPIPDGFHTVTPYLIVEGASKLLDFVKSAFGAEEISRHDGPEGKIMHAQFKIGDSIIMASDAREDYPPMPAMMYLYVTDCDATYRQAIAAGATSLMEPTDQFYGDRHGGVLDPVGNQWWISTHVEDVTPEEIQRRQGAQMGKSSAG